MTKDQFIEEVFEIAFGHDAINRNFEYSEVIEQLQEYNEHSLLWDTVNDYDKEFYEKEFYTEQAIRDKYHMDPKNFIIHKTLLGDNSDKVKGVKGLGEKGLLKKFPELKEKVLTLDDIYKICEQKYKDHVVYARVIQGIDELEKNYKIMDLSNPMLDENDKKYLTQVVNTNNYNYIPEQFVAFYNEDKLGGMIRNVEFWVKDIFEKLKL